MTLINSIQLSHSTVDSGNWQTVNLDQRVLHGFKSLELSITRASLNSTLQQRFKFEFKGQLKFKQWADLNNFEFFQTIVDNGGICEEIKVIINYCDNKIFRGVIRGFSLDCKFCVATVSEIKPDNINTCIEDNKSRKVSFFDCPNFVSKFSNFPTTITQRICTKFFDADTDIIEPYICADVYPLVPETGQPRFWWEKNTRIRNQGTFDPDTNELEIDLEISTTWWREELKVPIGTVVPDEWIFFSTDGTFDVYIRCPIVLNVDVSSFDRGRRFNDAIEKIIKGSLQECNVTEIRSNFFGIDTLGSGFADNPAFANNAYIYALGNYQNISIHNKRSIIDPTAEVGATSVWFELSYEELENIFNYMFNVYVIYEDDGSGGFIAVIEHISYYEEQDIIDISDLNQQTTISPLLSKNPRFETWAMMDTGTPNKDFIGVPIEYRSACTDGEKEYKIRTVTTDLEFITQSLENSNFEVSNEGFVLIANDLTDVIKVDQGSYTGLYKPNAPLSIANLNHYIHRWDRSNLLGITNKQGFQETDFMFSAKPEWQGQESTGLYCCEDFNLPSFFKSFINDKYDFIDYGTLKELTVSNRSRKLTIKLEYRNV